MPPVARSKHDSAVGSGGRLTRSWTAQWHGVQGDSPATAMTASPGALASLCFGCKRETCIDLSTRTLYGPGGSQGGVTYLDTDLVVWDCPACGAPNAEAFSE
jgi:hypothetical protein